MLVLILGGAMGGKKNITSTRKVVVEIATHGSDGEPITDDMLDSGGARRPRGSGKGAGSLINQYTNPQPYEGPKDDAERELYARLDHEYEAERRNEEYRAQQARDQRNKDIADALIRVFEEEVAPRVARWWDARGPQDLRRFGMWASTPVRKLLSKTETTTASAPATETTTDDVEPATETPVVLADVIEVPEVGQPNVTVLADYRRKRTG